MSFETSAPQVLDNTNFLFVLKFETRLNVGVFYFNST